jgi:hypothetical protein
MRKIFILLLGFLIPLFCFSEADYVYHEATTNTIGLTPLQFRDIMTPNRTQSVKIGFKIEFQFYWNQARIYYTTDGSNPSGSFGVGNGTTQVVNVTFDHNFGSPVVDAVFGIIPAQPAGTVVKYIVSAWFDTGGDEIFGNGCGNAPRTFCSSDNKLASQATVFQYTVSTTARKIFTLDPNPDISLAGSNGSCTTPGSSTPNVFNIPVSGVGTMTSVNQLLLASIALSDCGTGSKNYNSIQIRIMSPSGQCFGVYSGGLTTLGTGTHFLNLVSATSCLNNPNTSNDVNGGSPFLSTGNNGFFNAQYLGTPTLYSNFTGTADGTWKVIFSESTANPPCVASIRLFFGDPNVIPQGTTGDNCSNPIVWDGSSPICANTTGMTGSSQMPGSIGGPNTNSFGTIGGVTCQWNNANNNEVWIKYTATASNTCLSVSGISGTGVGLQSIVVTDANTNDSDPCTQVPRTATNDPNWRVVSCPRPSIYGTTAGTQFNQQHCFTSEIGKTYYLVVDGDGGAASKFWIWGFSYNGILELQEVRVVYPNITPNNKINVYLQGSNLISDFGKYKYDQEVFIYDASGKLIFKQKRLVNGQNTLNTNNLVSSGIFFIKVLVYDKLITNFTFKLIKK